MNGLLNILEQNSGYTQTCADDLVPLLRGKRLSALFETGQHMLDET
jgi:hypothetical protein